jgi:hypothetical protein
MVLSSPQMASIFQPMTREVRQKEYRRLCESGKIKDLFMQPWWMDAAGEWDVALGFRNQQLVGAMPFAMHKKWGVRTIGLPLLTHHTGIWMDKPPDISDHKWLTREKQIIWSILESLPPHGFFSMVFDEKSFDNWLPFYWKGFRQEMRYTFVIDAADAGALDQHINRNLKRNLRVAEDAIEMVREVNPRVFYDVCAQTYKRQKMKMPYSFMIFSQTDKAIQNQEAGIKLAALSAGGKIISVAYLLWDRTKAYYFMAGDTDAGRATSAGLLLCREALRIAFEEKGLRSFDFCGSMIEPITEIRRQFGARAVPLMKIFKANHKWLDVMYQLTH